DPGCFGGARGNGCREPLSAIVEREHAVLGTTANYSDGISVLGAAIVEHHAYAPPNPNTTALCVGDRLPGAGRPLLTLTKQPDPARCRTAVSGERIVQNGVPNIEGLGTAGARRFWWSVEGDKPVQRTLAGLRRDGTLLLGVVAPTRDGVRGGLTTLDAARWLIAHGVTDAIALDGGHQAGMYVTGRGEVLGMQRGEPRLQVALLVGAAIPPPPPVAPAAVPAPAALPPAAPAAAPVAVRPLRLPVEPWGPAEASGTVVRPLPAPTVGAARPAALMTLAMLAVACGVMLLAGARRAEPTGG
ncbi:MAG TPA: phosphodiester glycosidase family protein, partial [Candidatus Dormibacteraeota bacterium]|nr:phosphodiester glycosidase family protein [Candidatus Dormibacteraeota bacterium]